MPTNSPIMPNKDTPSNDESPLLAENEFESAAECLTDEMPALDSVPFRSKEMNASQNNSGEFGPFVAEGPGEDDGFDADPIKRLAAIRGWSPEALRAFGAEPGGQYHIPCVKFPMRNAAGDVIGWKKRRADN